MVQEIYSAGATTAEWLNQGFEEAPFDENRLHQCHYRYQGFIFALNQMVTLDTTSICISHMHGESGCGKTTCLKSFYKMPSSYVQVYLPTAEGLSPINLLKTIYFHIKAKPNIVRKPCTEYIVNLAKVIARQNIKLRIIIDDAHTLPKKTIDVIQKLASVQPTGSHLQFLMASHHSIDSLNKNTTWDSFRIKTIPLANLSEAETQKYIKLCLTQASKELFQPQIPRETIEKIYQLSQGNIKRINQVSSRHLLKHVDGCKPSNDESSDITHALSETLSLAFEPKNLIKASAFILLGYSISTLYSTNTLLPVNLRTNQSVASLSDTQKFIVKQRLQNLSTTQVVAEANLHAIEPKVLGVNEKPSGPRKSPSPKDGQNMSAAISGERKSDQENQPTTGTDTEAKKLSLIEQEKTSKPSTQLPKVPNGTNSESSENKLSLDNTETYKKPDIIPDTDSTNSDNTGINLDVKKTVSAPEINQTPSTESETKPNAVPTTNSTSTTVRLAQETQPAENASINIDKHTETELTISSSKAAEVSQTSSTIKSSIPATIVSTIGKDETVSETTPQEKPEASTAKPEPEKIPSTAKSEEAVSKTVLQENIAKEEKPEVPPTKPEVEKVPSTAMSGETVSKTAIQGSMAKQEKVETSPAQPEPEKIPSTEKSAQIASQTSIQESAATEKMSKASPAQPETEEIPSIAKSEEAVTKTALPEITAKEEKPEVSPTEPEAKETPSSSNSEGTLSQTVLQENMVKDEKSEASPTKTEAEKISSTVNTKDSTAVKDIESSTNPKLEPSREQKVSLNTASVAVAQKESVSIPTNVVKSDQSDQTEKPIVKISESSESHTVPLAEKSTPKDDKPATSPPDTQQ
ncbi:MAG: AAA family ATPase [Pseudomonadota bacterium]|nr:AAA family ATPase [Pseudomonadota bacterium]